MQKWLGANVSKKVVGQTVQHIKKCKQYGLAYQMQRTQRIFKSL